MDTTRVKTGYTVADKLKSLVSPLVMPADRNKAMDASEALTKNWAGNKFKTFLSIISVPADRHEAINKSARGVARKINSVYWPLAPDPRHLHIIGSYGRGTAMRDLNNIKVLAILPSSLFKRFHSYPGKSQMYLLRDVAAVLTAEYKATFISDERKLLIPFDGGYQLEIIPGFTNKKNSITYPELSNEGRWEYFNPLKEIEAVALYNSQYGGKVKHLARMMRAWKTHYNAPIPSLLIDTLVMNFMDDWEGSQTSYGYYGQMVQDFLEYMAGLKKEHFHWYARGSNREIYRHEDFGVQANIAYKKAVMANRHETESHQLEANLCWKDVFGDLFPNTSCLG